MTCLLSNIVTSISPEHSIRIAEIISDLTLEEKVRMLSGDLDFWPGLNAMLNEDYYDQKPFPAAVSERNGLTGLQFIDGPQTLN